MRTASSASGAIQGDGAGKRWISYSAAAVAAAMAGTDEADAAIIYSGTLNIPILSDTFQLETSLGSAFGTLTHSTLFSSVFQGVAKARGENTREGKVAGVAGFAYNLPFNTPLTAGLPFLGTGSTGQMAYANSGGSNQFASAGIGFLGFQFDMGNGPQFGWARVDMSGPTLNEIVLIDFAYALNGTAINVGQTAVIPEPSSLGLLAIGAAGLLAARRATRRRKVSDEAGSVDAA